MKKKKQPQAPPPWFKHADWIIPVLAILVYLQSFSADFTLDDIPVIEENEIVKNFNLSKIWTTHYWAGKIDASDTGLYRPLTITSYSLQYAITGNNPAPFHILNILLHALACVVLWKYLQLLFRNYLLTTLSVLFFAVHPVHTEAVSGIVGRAEILAALFILLSGICYHQWRQKGGMQWLALFLISSVAAITSKEHGFMIPVILGLQEFIYYFRNKKQTKNPGRIWIAMMAVLVVSAILWTLRSSITGPSKPHEQWLAVETADRMATSVRTTLEYVGLHLLPLKLSADYWTDTFRIVSWGNTIVLLAFIISLALIGLAVWQFKKMNGFSWGLLFFYLTLAPVSNFFFAAGFLKAERILYIPSIGLITAVAALLLMLYKSKNGRVPALILIAGMFLFFTVRTWMRSSDWKNNQTLAEATLKISPGSPRFNNMLGLEMREQNRHQEALHYFETSVRSNPNHVPALVNLGTEYKNAGRLEEAASTLERALTIDPGTMMTYVNLMAVYREMKNYDKNLEIAELALQRYPNSAPVLWNAGNAYQLKGNMAKAEELRGKALEINPDLMKKE